MSNQSNPTQGIISLPQGGGALSGIGEKFAPDLHTGTGNFNVPIALPPGRNGFQPQLNLVYSTGSGNGPFGLGWGLSIPGVSRKTSAGVPRYNEHEQDLKPGHRRDILILSGAEDLVPVSGSYPGIVQYRPRTEGLFAWITHHRGQTTHDNYWEVESKDGLISVYGRPAAGEAAVLAQPDDSSRIFAWKLTETKDTFGNLIRYHYERDSGDGDGHRWDQPLLKQISYVDYDNPSAPKFLVTVDFEYEDRPDPFSDTRAGFEIRSTRRCRAVKISTHTEDRQHHPVREYRFAYATDPYNSVSLLQQLDIIGYDDNGHAYDEDDPQGSFKKLLPALTFGYTRFDPQQRQFEVVAGRDLPARALGAPDMELVDLHGSGLPDILEMNGVVRYWRNLGSGRFDLPRMMQSAPPHTLADPGVQMIDANGDGRMDLLVSSGALAGYYPLAYGARWDAKSFQRYPAVPSFRLDDPEVKLVDLDGDGYTDVLRSGSRMECFFNDPDPRLAWQRNQFTPRQALSDFPNVKFSDPRVRLADMNGDGLQDIVLIHDGNVEYWPNLGHNRWGKRLTMRHAPRFPYGYDPQRILLGDVDGDGLADLVYVDHGRVLLWINQSGNAWAQDPVEISGTPPGTNMDNVRLVDLNGTGVSGVLWSSEASGQQLMFLDFTGGRKPYVLDEMDNHMGALTRVEYRSSTADYLRDQQKPATRWRTPLPFPVQVVARVEVIDQISRGKLTTEYRYHHGYWDGAEREFRGFGVVEQIDCESFAEYHAAGLHGNPEGFKPVSAKQFSPPTLTKTWFHQGPVGEEFGDWQEIDYTREYWPDDPQLLGHTTQVNAFLRGYQDRANGTASPRNRRVKRDALRTLRGSILRSELYTLDGGPRQERPYTVSEHAYALREEAPPAVGELDRMHIFFPHPVAQRTTQWERGNDPMTLFTLVGDYDAFGQPRRQSSAAMPRLTSKRSAISGAVVGGLQPDETHILATNSHTQYALSSANRYIHDRVSQTFAYELANPENAPDSAGDDLQAALRKQWSAAGQIHARFIAQASADVHLIGHQINHYDGPDFEGLPAGQLGDRGALIRSEVLAFTGDLLDRAYGQRRPAYLDGPASLPANAPAGFGSANGYRMQPSNPPGGSAAYYTDTLRQQLSPRGLTVAAQDALKRETAITYDGHEMLPLKVLDPIGLETTAAHNYRLLQLQRLTEPNGSSTHVRYDPIGLPLSQFVSGLDAQGRETLGGSQAKPEIRFEYDFLHFEQDGLPISVHSTRRVQHASDNFSDDTLETREYSDGFGRLIQTRAQAEELVFGLLGDEVGLPPGGAPTPAVGSHAADRVVVSGWQVFDNKGRVIEKYEPFFSAGWDFAPEGDAVHGQHATMFYDPRGNVIRTLNPDGSQQRVILGRPRNVTQLALTASDLESSDVPSSFEPTPWETYIYDANDLAGLTHPGPGAVPAGHYFTPVSSLSDCLGRACCVMARNGANPQSDWFITRSSYDIRGNPLAITDALGRTAFRYNYDLLDRALAVDSLDAGRRTSVSDALGNLVEYRDSKGSLALRIYDELNRPKELWAQNDSAGALTLRERIHYGDEDPLAPARKHNTLGRPVRHYDEAGLLEMPDYDFKGNLLEKSRRTIKDDRLASNWLADWSAANAEDALETAAHRTSSRYDGLNRPTEITYPRDVDGTRKKLRPRYNRAGALEAVQLENDEYVQQIAYNAKGQRVLISYGNGLLTRQAYDPLTFRLARLRSEQFTYSADTTAHTQTWSSSGPAVQEFSYNYDLTGNITAIDDHAPNSGIAGADRNHLLRAFSYDPLYRLLSATGRACKDIGAPRGLDDDPRCGFQPGGAPAPTRDNAPDLTEAYTERYDYDPAGNLLALRYTAASGAWTRRFGMSGFTPKQWSEKLSLAPAGGPPIDWGSEGNRLTNVGDETQARNQHFDPNGNLIQQNTERHHTWDHADRLIDFRVQPAPASPASLEARYLYGADGMRVKKWVRTQGGQVTTTVYIDGIFEQHRLIDSTGTRENNSLYVMDNQSRIALLRVGQPLDARDASPQVQYILGDHLGSNVLVVGGNDSSGRAFINREEYFAYGETSFGSFGRKRYRYSGKERDEESGLYYYGARYFASGLARWVSCDPVAPIDGLNPFVFVRNAPITSMDRKGLATKGSNAVTESAPFDPSSPSTTGVQAEGYIKSSTEVTRVPGGNHPGWKVTTTFKGPKGSNLPDAFYQTKVTDKGVLMGTGDTTSLDTPGNLGGNDLAGRVRGEHLIAIRDVARIVPTSLDIPVVHEDSAIQLKQEGPGAFLKTKIGDVTRIALAAIGQAVDPKSLGVSQAGNATAKIAPSKGTAGLAGMGFTVGSTLAIGGLGVFMTIIAMKEAELYANDNYDELVAAGIDPMKPIWDESIRQVGGLTGGIVASEVLASALAGAGVGSVEPGLGTAIGFVVGTVGGIAGYNLADQFTDDSPHVPYDRMAYRPHPGKM